ncbi:MAG: relaxase/mobilization nuclease and DUF3363 domain-containing protein [Sphingomonadaceae bacterium]|nr:relaxase/mobilization nuclease and DUF3363 domain-containing protein [Sphingomonadaceae bacterium]
MEEDDLPFEPRLGRQRARGGGRVRAPRLRAELVTRIRRAGADPRRLAGAAPFASSRPRTGRFNARGRGAKLAASFPRGSGWSFDRGLGVRVRPRRVTVKARVVKLAGKGKAAAAHMRYLERDGVARDGQPARLYSTFTDEADGKAYLERCGEDRHQFRFIVAPEDGAAFESLHGFTRDLMAQMERDLGTTLDWVAVDHHDTGHPHSHILVCGVTEDGKTLNIAGDYIAHGIRHRASEIMTRDLGPQTERELRQQLEAEIDAERLTRLDRAILQRAGAGRLDLRLTPSADPEYQQLLVARVRKLDAMELATKDGPLCWMLKPDAEQILADMGRRGDIIRLMDQAITGAMLDRRRELFEIHESEQTAPIVGKVIRRGAADDNHHRRYLIIDGVDGRTHYIDIGANEDATHAGSIVRLQPARAEVKPADRVVAEIAAAHGDRYSNDIHLRHDPSASEAFAEAHIHRLEALRRAGVGVEREADGSWTIAPDHFDRVAAHEHTRVAAQPVRIEMLSTVSLEKQTVAQAPTWLDAELTGNSASDIADHGFGREVRQALYQRQQWLIEQRLADRDGEEVMFRSDMLSLLRQRELTRVAARLSRELGLDYAEARSREKVEGIYRRPVELAYGRYALIEKSREFTLVPWRPVLERHAGRAVSGIMRGDAISWTIGRGRGQSIS